MNDIVFAHVLLAQALVVTVVVVLAQKMSHQAFPRKLWHLLWLYVTVVCAFCALVLVPHYVWQELLPGEWRLVAGVILVSIMVYALARSFRIRV